MKKIILLFVVFISGLNAFSQVGKLVRTVRLTDIQARDCNLPCVGIKPFVLLYVDPDVQVLSSALQKNMKSKIRAELFGRIAVLAVVNCKDSWIPVEMIQERLQGHKKLQSLVFVDKNSILSRAWNIDQTNNTIVVLFVGRNSKIKYLARVSSQRDAEKQLPLLRKAIEDECN